jgi:hypothetical protein
MENVDMDRVIKDGLRLLIDVVKSLEYKYSAECFDTSNPYGNLNQIEGPYRHTTYFALTSKKDETQKKLYSIRENTGLDFCITLKGIIYQLMDEVHNDLNSNSQGN